MKFLITAQRFHTNLYYRAKALQDAGHDVKVIVLYKGKSEFYENIDLQQIELSFFSKLLLKIISFFKKNNLKSGFELRIQSPGKELRKIIKSYNPDVIILKAYQNMLALKTLLIVKKSKVKVLMLTQTPHTHIKGSRYLFKLNIKLFKFLKVFAYITPVKSNYDAFKNFGIENVYYLPFVYPTENINITKDYNLLLKIISAGKYVRRKDQKLLINACKELIKDKKVSIDFYGEIADKQYFEELKSLIKYLNLKADIRLNEYIDYRELQNKYKEYDIFVLPSYSEPAAFSIVEAAANGLPVICSDQNGTKSYIKEGENGYIFEARNLNDLTDKIKLMISDKEKLKEMSKNSLLSAQKNHSIESFGKAILKIIKNNEIIKFS